MIPENPRNTKPEDCSVVLRPPVPLEPTGSSVLRELCWLCCRGGGGEFEGVLIKKVGYLHFCSSITT